MEKLYAGIDVMIKRVPMPRKLKGFLIEDCGVYCIYVNSEVSIEEQKKAIKHEINHLIRDDINCDCTANEIERGMNT